MHELSVRGSAEPVHDEIHYIPPAAPAALRPGAQAAGELVYERVVPALASSVTRVRHELDDALAALAVDAARREEIALAVTEATTNAVLHAYCDQEPGPLALTASRAAGAILVTVSDWGRGMQERSHSPGLGLGVGLMSRLSDTVRVAANEPDRGTRVSLVFRHAVPTAVVAFAPGPGRQAAALRRYVPALAEPSAAACDDTRALLAQARQTPARALQLRLERDRLSGGAE
jgi:serine/threonine-protein kinase RsbW